MRAIEIEKHYPEGRLVIRPYQDGSEYHLLTVDIPSDWQIYDEQGRLENPGRLGGAVASRYGSWVHGKPVFHYEAKREFQMIATDLVPVTVGFRNDKLRRIFGTCAKWEVPIIDFIRSGIFDVLQYIKKVDQASVPDFLMDGFHYEKGSPVGAFRYQLSDKQMNAFEMGARKLNFLLDDYAVACVIGLARSGVKCGRVRWPKNPVISFTAEIDAHIMTIVKKAAGKMSWQAWCQGAIVDMLESMGVEA